MRRVVRSRIAAALERARPMLEEFIGQHLGYPLGFPHRFGHAAVRIREVQKLTVIPLVKWTDLPPVEIEVTLKAWLCNRAVELRGDWDPGIFLDVDIQLTARGTVVPDGSYDVEPRSARLTSWWDMVSMESQRFRLR
jgi:hypothetical protein